MSSYPSSCAICLLEPLPYEVTGRNCAEYSATQVGGTDVCHLHIKKWFWILLGVDDEDEEVGG